MQRNEILGRFRLSADPCSHHRVAEATPMRNAVEQLRQEAEQAQSELAGTAVLASDAESDEGSTDAERKLLQEARHARLQRPKQQSLHNSAATSHDTSSLTLDQNYPDNAVTTHGAAAVAAQSTGKLQLRAPSANRGLQSTTDVQHTIASSRFKPDQRQHNNTSAV